MGSGLTRGDHVEPPIGRGSVRRGSGAHMFAIDIIGRAAKNLRHPHLTQNLDGKPCSRRGALTADIAHRHRLANAMRIAARRNIANRNTIAQDCLVIRHVDAVNGDGHRDKTARGTGRARGKAGLPSDKITAPVDEVTNDQIQLL